jgi:tRNA pseudouridine55 synthase
MRKKPIMRRKGAPLHGWVVLDKPLGLTSTQALAKVRWLLGAQKAGHGGTLDPLASGLLPIALGEATKLIPFIMDGEKTYHFTIGWGEARSTEDAEGAITATSAVRPTATAIQAILPRFLGAIQQMPPIFSALKVAGERAYDLARAGKPVELAARTVQITALELLACPDADHADLTVSCGKGTYVRSLARDIALALGTVGHITALRRTQVGAFHLAQTISLEKLAELAHKDEALTALRPMLTVLDDIPALPLDPQNAHRLRHGQSILAASTAHLPPLLVAIAEGQPVALIARRETLSTGEVWHPVRGFNL